MAIMGISKIFVPGSSPGVPAYMAFLEIRKFKDPVLRQKSEKVKVIDFKVKKLIEDMRETMLKKDGIGLAAPQVGMNKRIIVINPELSDSGISVLINPKIVKKSPQRELGEEGCLSFPGVFLKIKRAKRVEVEAEDINGKNIIIKASGLFSRVLQHEIDHLDGILFFNRLGFFQRLRFKKNGNN